MNTITAVIVPSKLFNGKLAPSNKELILQNRTLTDFVHHIQRRAFRIAEMSVGNSEDALDIVQDATIKLVQLYAENGWDEWRPLFYRILHNKINDFHRRKTVHERFRIWLRRDAKHQDSEPLEDPLEQLPGNPSADPQEQSQLDQQMQIVSQALQQLPNRQREAFILRCWEGMSTAETAIAMKCSEGSVKTHYSRALVVLRRHLKEA